MCLGLGVYGGFGFRLGFQGSLVVCVCLCVSACVFRWLWFCDLFLCCGCDKIREVSVFVYVLFCFFALVAVLVTVCQLVCFV